MCLLFLLQPSVVCEFIIIWRRLCLNLEQIRNAHKISQRSHIKHKQKIVTITTENSLSATITNPATVRRLLDDSTFELPLRQALLRHIYYPLMMVRMRCVGWLVRLFVSVYNNEDSWIHSSDGRSLDLPSTLAAYEVRTVGSNFKCML